MFNDEFGLTKAVLKVWKTMTRRIVPQGVISLCERGMYEMALGSTKYKVGEVVAVAQNLRDMGYNPRDTKHRPGAIWGLDHSPAWTNKMFVSASECIHQIRITNIRVERLQNISDEDCFREGIDVSFQNGHAVSYYRFENSRTHYFTPREAFAALIDKVSGKGTWDSNPWVFVYEFELIR